MSQPPWETWFTPPKNTPPLSASGIEMRHGIGVLPFDLAHLERASRYSGAR